MARGKGSGADETMGSGMAKKGLIAKKPRRKPVKRASAASPPGEAAPGDTAPLAAASIAAMDEATLRRTVIIPLLEAQGWRDVREGHGATERGKDIVAWCLGDDGQADPLAVVAKATAIDGQAKITNRSAGGVANQVLQCFGAPAIDRATGDTRAIGRCQVITNKAIAQTGSDAFWDIMRGTIHAEKIELIDGKRLWELVREILPQALVGRVIEARKAAESFADPHYRLDFASEEAGISFTIRERYAGAFAERPLTVGIADSPGAADAATAQLRVTVEDTAVTLDGEAAQAVQLPEQFRHLLPPGGLRSVTIDLPERLAEYSVDLRLDDGTGSPLIIGPLAVDLHQIAGARARFTNRRQAAPPLRCWYDVDLAPAPDGGVLYTTGTLHYGPGTWNVKDRRRVARLRARLRRPCTLRLVDRATWRMLVEGQLPAEAPSPGLDSILLLFDGLVALQDRTGVPIAVPDDLSAEVLAVLRTLATIALTGALVETWDALALPVPVANINPDLLAALLDGGSVPLGLSGQAEEGLGDDVIPLGAQRVALASARLTNADEVREALSAGAASVTLRLAPGEDATAVRRYSDWGPRNDTEDTQGVA